MLSRIISVVVLVTASLHASSWKPIPPDVWAMKEEVSKGKGAVVLSERIHYGPKRIEYDYKVRIFSEAGRTAAHFSNLPVAPSILEGRTVYSDGREVIFNSKKDMKELDIKASGSESKTTVLEPPGVTTNCVVELRWRQDPFSWGGFQGEFQRWILNSVPTLESTIEFSKMLPAGTLIRFGQYTPEEREDSYVRSFTFRNLPAADSAPFQQRPLNAEPRFVVYSMPAWLWDVQKQTPDPYWNAVGERFFKELFTNISKGWNWSSFSKEILTGLPEGDPHRAATEILLRLDSRIANRSELTPEERERHKNNGLQEDIDPRALSAAIKRGWTSSSGMYYLAFQLLRDAGLKPKLLLVANRYEKTVQISTLNLFQYDHYLLAVEAPGKGTLIVDPQDRTLPVGIIPTVFQSTTALQVDSDTWKISTFAIGSGGADLNLRSFDYQHTFAEGQHTVSCESRFSGIPEYYERDRYFSLAQALQLEKLKEDFEDGNGGWTVQSSEVRGSGDRRKPISTRVTAVREFEEGRRMQMNPFPGMPSAIPIPDALPEFRKVPISIGYSRTHRASARISIPAGFHLVAMPAMDHKNFFGRLHWEAKPDSVKANEILVSYELELTQASASELYYNAFVQFLGWVREAQTRQLVLEREN